MQRLLGARAREISAGTLIEFCVLRSEQEGREGRKVGY